MYGLRETDQYGPSQSLVFNNTGASMAKGDSLFTDFGRFIGSSRDIDEYRRRFSGKRILNLGSSHNGYIEQNLCAIARNIQFVSLDPTSSFGRYGARVKGIAQDLPFANNSFDIVISTWSFPLLWTEALRGIHTLRGEPIITSVVLADLARAAEEVCRVLEAGGEAWLSPLDIYRIDHASIGLLQPDMSVKDLVVSVIAGTGLNLAESRDCEAEHGEWNFSYQSGVFKKAA